MYTLYYYPGSGNCYKVYLMLKLLELPVEKIKIDILKGESRTPEFLAKNPNGRVPTLAFEDKVLPESNAALYYLARDSRYFPTEKFAQAQVMQWLFFEQYSHEPFIATLRFWIHIARQEEKYAEQIKQRRPQGDAALQVMDNHLARQEFFVDNHFSIADIALFAYTHVAGDAKFNLAQYPNILNWIQRLETQPGFISMDTM